MGLAEKRHQLIVQALEENPFLTVQGLTEITDASLSTIRRDLILLEKQGLLNRTHGGAVSSSHELSAGMGRSHRESLNTDIKEIIGKATARMVSELGCIILDSGTTTQAVARYLFPERDLTVVTDCIEIAHELRDRKNVTVIVTGGILKRGSQHMYGAFAMNMLDSIHGEVCILGTSGLTLEEGLTKYDIESLDTKRKMIENSHKLICVADSSKFSMTGMVSICQAGRIDVLVTDNGVEKRFIEQLQKLKVEVVIVN